MGRFPVVITLGAALLGYVAGEMAVTDPVAAPWIEANALWLHMFAPLLGAVLVVLAGKYFARRKKRAVVEVAVEQQDSKP
jgi:predicted tellurium resistance membrane protein TerC